MKQLLKPGHHFGERCKHNQFVQPSEKPSCSPIHVVVDNGKRSCNVSTIALLRNTRKSDKEAAGERVINYSITYRRILFTFTFLSQSHKYKVSQVF